MPPVKNPCVMTSYGGIIRIRLKGRSLITSSQPASQAPLYLFYFSIHIILQKTSTQSKNECGFLYSSQIQTLIANRLTSVDT